MGLSNRFRLAGILFLVAGVIAQIFIYRTPPAADDSDIIGYDLSGGTAVPIRRNSTKRDLLALEKMGGKANVAAAQFTTWFSGLWHGRQLGDTLAVLSVLAFLLCFLLGHLLTDPPPPDEPAREPKV